MPFLCKYIPVPNEDQSVLLRDMGIKLYEYSDNYVRYELPFGWSTGIRINTGELVIFDGSKIRVIVDDRIKEITIFNTSDDDEIELK